MSRDFLLASFLIISDISVGEVSFAGRSISTGEKRDPVAIAKYRGSGSGGSVSPPKGRAIFLCEQKSVYYYLTLFFFFLFVTNKYKTYLYKVHN